MRLTTKGRYAVTAMLDLAFHSGSEPVSLASIAERQAISLSYLEQIFSQLKNKGLVTSVKGPGGGYFLARESSNIFVSEVMDAVNESVDATRCRGASDCQLGITCLTHYLWRDLNHQINTFLRGVSLSDLMSRGEVQLISFRQDRQKQAAESRVI